MEVLSAAFLLLEVVKGNLNCERRFYNTLSVVMVYLDM